MLRCWVLVVPGSMRPGAIWCVMLSVGFVAVYFGNALPYAFCSSVPRAFHTYHAVAAVGFKSACCAVQCGFIAIMFIRVAAFAFAMAWFIVARDAGRVWGTCGHSPRAQYMKFSHVGL